MQDRPTYRPAYKAIHRPLTVCGVDRRLFFVALIPGAAAFNLFCSFLAGLLMFAGQYGFALWATRRDPDAADPAVILEGPTPLRPRQIRAVRAEGGVVVSIKRMFRDYKEAGSVNGLIGVSGFVDDLRSLRRPDTLAALPPEGLRLRGADARSARRCRTSPRSRPAIARRTLAGVRVRH
jgi:hypothetical protein